MKLSERFPDLTFTLSYKETGCDFRGVDEIVDGDIVSSVSGSCFLETDCLCSTCGNPLIAELDYDGSVMEHYCNECDEEIIDGHLLHSKEAQLGCISTRLRDG